MKRKLIVICSALLLFVTSNGCTLTGCGCGHHDASCDAPAFAGRHHACRSCGRIGGGGCRRCGPVAGVAGRIQGIGGRLAGNLNGNVFGGADMSQENFTGPVGPATATYGYPYYTLRAPRDFLMDNPPSIGN
jgi:hypothetical protein